MVGEAGECGSARRDGPPARPVPHERAEQIARSAGLVVCPSVTKNARSPRRRGFRLTSGKARKARPYGTRIIVERAFWKALGIDVD